MKTDLDETISNSVFKDSLRRPHFEYKCVGRFMFSKHVRGENEVFGCSQDQSTGHSDYGGGCFWICGRVCSKGVQPVSKCFDVDR